MKLKEGTVLGSYSIRELLGSGGMGEVYRATDTRLKRDVAVKVLRERLAENPEALARFELEAQSIAALSTFPSNSGRNFRARWRANSLNRRTFS